MGGGGFGKRENAVNDGLEAPGGDEAHNAVKLGFGAHVGAKERELAAEEKAEVDLGVVARGGAAGDEAASGGEAGEAVIPSGYTDVLENNIDAALIGDAADFVADFLRFVIDEMIGAELFGFLQLFIGAGGSDHARAEKLCDLNGGAADTAAGPQDENILAGLQLGSSKKHVPGGLEYQRNRRGLVEAKIFRVRQAIYFRSAHEFRATAIDHIAQVSGLTTVGIKARYPSLAPCPAEPMAHDGPPADAPRE